MMKPTNIDLYVCTNISNIAVNRQSELTQTHGVASEMDNIIFYVCFVWTLYQARHLGGFESVPLTTKLKFYPGNIPQNQPYCSNLQLKINENPDLCLASANAKYQF